MDIFELQKLNELKEYIGEIKDIIEINTFETEQRTLNKVLELIKSEIHFNKMLERKKDVETLERIYYLIIEELF